MGRVLLRQQVPPRPEEPTAPKDKHQDAGEGVHVEQSIGDLEVRMKCM